MSCSDRKDSIHAYVAPKAMTAKVCTSTAPFLGA